MENIVNAILEEIVAALCPGGEASDECRHSARISENLPPIMVETGLAG